MINNKVVHLAYRSIFLALSFMGLLESFGLFAGQKFGFDCLLYYTTLSNILCFGVMIVVWIYNIKEVMKGDLIGNNQKLHQLKFYATIAILVTFLVYNFLLTDNMFSSGWNNLGNLTKHIFCPLLFVIDFLLFDRHHGLKWYDCLLCTVLPLLYVIVILIRGAILPTDYEGTVYPYFFLNTRELGYGGVVVWVFILVIIFVIIAGLFYLFDKVERKDGKFIFYFKNTENKTLDTNMEE